MSAAHPSRRQFTPFQTLVFKAYYATMPYLENRMKHLNVRPSKIHLVYNDAAFRHLGEQLLEIAGAHIYGLPVELVDHEHQSHVLNDPYDRMKVDRPVIRLDLVITAPTGLGHIDPLLNSVPISVYIDKELDDILTYDWEIQP